MKIKLNRGNKFIFVEVANQDCQKNKCFVPSCANTNENNYYCRIREVSGCPEKKEIAKELIK